MKSIVPAWIRQMPFGRHISPLWVLMLVVAIMGLTTVGLGILAHDPVWIMGLIAVIPFLFLNFLLWRTYRDDGYGVRQ